PPSNMSFTSPRWSDAQVLLLLQVTIALVVVATPLSSRTTLVLSVPVPSISLTQFFDSNPGAPTGIVGSSIAPPLPLGSSRAKAMLMLVPVTLAWATEPHTAAAVTARARTSVHPNDL